MQVPYYNIHKIMQGLLDQHLLLGNAQAFDIVLKMASYFYRRITHLIATNGTDTWDRVLNTETGGMNDVMYQIYQLTNNSDHLKMATLLDLAAAAGRKWRPVCSIGMPVHGPPATESTAAVPLMHCGMGG